MKYRHPADTMALKILLIGPAPPPFGGMANQARLLAQCLAKEKVQVVFVPTNRLPPVISPKIWHLPVLRSIGKFSMYAVGAIRNLKNSTTIHILACSHTYFYVNVIPAIFIGKLFKKKVVINYRGGEAETFFKGTARFFLWVFRLSDSLVVPSRYLHTAFQNMGLNATIIPNISEIERFSFRLPEYSGKIRFVCTRNFEAYYDVITLVRAFKSVKGLLPESTLTLIGEGSLKNTIVEYVQKNNLSDSVTFAGRVDPAKMPDQLLQHDIYVNTSIVDNYPISLLEAFSSGLPVISTAAGGIPYMVEHGITGLLVEPGNHETLAQEMIRLANDLNLGRALAANARKIADNHAWERIWPELKRMYQ